MFMRHISTVAVKYFFLTGMEQPIMIISEQFSGIPRMPFFLLLCTVWSGSYKGFCTNTFRTFMPVTVVCAFRLSHNSFRSGGGIK